MTYVATILITIGAWSAFLGIKHPDGVGFIICLFLVLTGLGLLILSMPPNRRPWRR